MEKIIKIEDHTINEDSYSEMDGYKITTDKQEIELLINTVQDCCERAGYFWCNDNPQDFVGASLTNITITDTELNEAIMKVNALDPSAEWFEGGVMFVNIGTDKGVLQFVAYNEHNGYYGHEAIVKSRQLTHSETL
jgi:hypothetical protein